jgi:hypothetical protein
MCRFEQHDTLHFFMLALPFFVTTIGGMVLTGYGWYLLGWLAFAIFFFFGWEARVLCSHCPYWAEPSKVLHCHANYGVIKIWKYRPGPMSKAEQIQFVIGALLLILYPILFLFVGEAYLLASIAAVSAISWAYLMRRNVCNRCINFSCPMNAVPQTDVEAYLRRNPIMQKAWKQKMKVSKPEN